MTLAMVLIDGVQELAGVREYVAASAMETFIRPYMPPQHAAFFENQVGG